MGKHLTEKVTAVVSLTRVRPHNAHPTAKINILLLSLSAFVRFLLKKLLACLLVKDLALMFFDQCLYFHQDVICQKKYFEQAYFCVIFFTHIHLMRRLSSMVNHIAVTTSLLTSGLHRC